jgi:mitochondrial fission protein ELM1
VRDPKIVWRLRDGKAGHERQTAGLLRELQLIIPLSIYDIACESPYAAIHWWCARSFPPGAALPAPSLIVGAGRACQWPTLAARRARGGRTIYCMHPGLPTRWFDLCLIPQHDGAVSGDHIELTRGMLNDVLPGLGIRKKRTLILVGGPSRHHRWDEHTVMSQIASLVFGRRERNVVISDSRRTPETTSDKLQSFVSREVAVVRHRNVDGSWLVNQLQEIDEVWITADSVSMIYEALTAGVAVGIIDIPALRNDRITRLSTGLIDAQIVTSFAQWRSGATLKAPFAPLAEAARCARLIADRWF